MPKFIIIQNDRAEEITERFEVWERLDNDSFYKRRVGVFFDYNHATAFIRAMSH